MIRLIRTFPLALTLALGMGVLSCAVPPAPILERQARVGSASLVVMPRVMEAPAIQAVVTAPTVANISRLDVIPMVETSPGIFQPFKADGTPTVLGDPQAVLASQGLSSLKLDRGITLTGLARNTKYRVLARAYDAQGKLLSVDAGSSVDVTVGVDDAPGGNPLPVQLADVPFAAKTTISLINDAVADYASVVTTLVTVSGGTETLVPGSMQTLTKAQIPMLLAFDGLMANTTYRLNASLRDASNAQMATASVEIAVTNDDTPAGKTLTLRAGLLTILAGAFPTASSGLVDGTGTVARFNTPFHVVPDASGNLYVADFGNHAIRKITPAGVVTTFAGASTKTAGFTDGTGTAARFNQPSGIALDSSGNLFVSDYGNHAIRKITPAGVVTTFAGASTKTAGFTDGTGTAARFNQPSGIALDSSGNLFVSEYLNHAIRKITPAGVVTTFAGAFPTPTNAFVNGTGTAARFSSPVGLAVDASNNLYVADRSNNAIRKITPAGVVTTFAGGVQGYVNGTGTAASFKLPYGVAVDASNNVYVADTSNHAIRKITPGGVVSTILGSQPPETPGFVDATGTDARLKTPYGVAVDASGTIYVADGNNHAIRRFK